MDKEGLIYISDDVPEEDAARLDGYLRGRAEEDMKKKMEQEIAAYKEAIKKLDQ